MPYKIVKEPHHKFEVINEKTGRISAKHTTKGKAVKQMRLLYAIEHNPHFLMKK